jgi:hypothetical protein
VPSILYHWRAGVGSVALAVGEKTYAYTAALKSIQEHLDRAKTAARVTPEAHRGYYRVHRPLPSEPPSVSIIVPALGHLVQLRQTITSLIEETEYPNFEVVVVDRNVNHLRNIAELPNRSRAVRFSVLQCEEASDWEGLATWAARQVDSPILCFVSSGIEVLTADWLAEMVSHALRPQVGAVGGKVYGADGNIEHAGIFVGPDGEAQYPHRGLPRGDTGYFGRAVCLQQFSAVGGGCLLVGRELFFQLGGFADASVTVVSREVDFGMRLRKAGYSILWTPYAEFRQHDGVKGATSSPSKFHDRVLMSNSANVERQQEPIYEDPFCNPNLTLLNGFFNLASPPRVHKPWLAECRSQGQS